MQARAIGRGRAVGKRREIYLDAVTKGSHLDNECDTREHEQRDPEVRQAVIVVDVAGVSKTEGDSAEDQSDGQDNCWYSPACSKGSPHEAIPQGHLPTDLQVESDRSQAYPHHGATASKEEKGTRDRARPARLHIIRRDSVEALFGLGSKRHDEAQLHGRSADVRI